MKKAGSLFLILVFTFFSVFCSSADTTHAAANGDMQVQKLKQRGFKSPKFHKDAKKTQFKAQKQHKNVEYDVVATMNEDTKDVVLEVESTEKSQPEVYQVDIHEADGDLLVATFTDKATGKKYEVDNTKAKSNFAFVIPIGIVIGEALVAHLLAASLAIVVAGVTYVAATEIASKLRKEKRYEHYAATLNKAKTGMYIGPSLTYKQAKSKLKKGDVWSISKSLARKVAQGAGGNRIPIGPEIHNKDKNGKVKSGKYYYHYHTYNRAGGHSFY